MSDIHVPWASIKSFVDQCIAAGRQISLKYIDSNGNYFIWVIDGPFSISTILSQEDPQNSELIDFEANYKPTANASLNQLDTDGAAIVRLKAAKKGWSFWAIPIEATTSSIGSLYCKLSTGTDISWITYKIYDQNDVEITDPGDAGVNLVACVKTIIDFEPVFDYEVIGGAMRIHANPSQDVRLWIVGAPDIPSQFGGSKEFASGINLKFLAPDSSFEIDGRVTKFLTYNAVTHQGKMRIILKHPAGLQMNFQIVIHLYRL